MEKNDCISILMPVKNSSEYLNDCLDSIISQTNKEWELICVDDHSTDNSWEILESYSKKDSRILIFKNSGKGIIEALKLAYSKSSGKYIHRMDSDDIMPINKLELLYKSLLKFGHGKIITGKVEYFSRTKIVPGYKHYQNWLNGLIDTDTHWENIWKECVIPSPAWIVYREDFENAGAFDSTRYPEDYDLAFRFYQSGLKVRGIKEKIHLWREHPERTSRKSKNYVQRTFLECKIYHFMKSELKDERLAIIGSGIKKKLLEQVLNIYTEQSCIFLDNREKNSLFGQIGSMLDSEKKFKFIIAIADKTIQKELIRFFNKFELLENRDYYFFS